MANNALAPNIDNVLSDYVYAGRKLREQRNKNMLNPQVSLSDRLESLSYAAGEGFADQLRGLQQLVTHPVQSAQDIYSGVKYAVQNPREAAQAAVEGLKGAVQSPESATRFIAQNFSPAELATGLGKLGTMREIVVHHGTPHRFEPTEANPLGEFNASKIGTGEGAAAYGHGIYFAENPDVAKGYRIAGGHGNWIIDGKLAAATTTKTNSGPINYAAAALQRFDGDKKQAIEWLNNWGTEKEAKTILRKAKEIEKSEGSFYKADLPDEMVDRMLDWDKPLSEQSAYVQKAIENMKNDPNVNFPSLKPEQTGQSLYTFLGKQDQAPAEFGGRKFIRNDKPTISDLLRQHGIGGIKYLDAGSRGQAGTGTRNFVVFPGEEKKVKILERK